MSRNSNFKISAEVARPKSSGYREPVMSGSYNRKDHLYKRAKEEGFASRASFKLIELNKRFSILKQGAKVLDLGCWPGGWLQVASERVGPRGMVVGIDLVPTETLSLSNVKTITGDARSEEVIEQAIHLGGSRFDVVLSDMSPKLTGIKEADQAGTVACAELALEAADRLLRPGGDLLIKVFKGNDTEQFVKSARSRFNATSRVELDSTRKTSNEFYLVFRGFRGGSEGPATI